MARDCQGWKDCGLELTTTSNEACKLLDAAIKQLTDRKVGEYGALDKTVQDLYAADPEFVMGTVFILSIMLGENETMKANKAIIEKVAYLQTLLEKQSSVLTQREKQHAQAVIYLASEQPEEACLEWVAILAAHPRDMMALKWLYLWQIMMGRFEEMRDVMARILPAWNQTDMEYGYLVGMYAFALQETHFYEKGRQRGLQALEINARDTWATHTMAHVYLMTGDIDTGTDFMGNTTAQWDWDGGLACHNYWHNALFHVEKGDFASALDIYDLQVGRRAKTDKTLFQLSDAVSLLYRLQFEGIDPGAERWREVAALSEPRIGNHTHGLYDAHVMIAACSSHRQDLSTRMLESMKAMVKGEKNYISQTAASVTLPICEAIAAYENHEYDQAVDYLLPVRYKTQPMGGSTAQRDVFNQLLVHSALKSPREEHQKLAQQLLLERKAFQGESPLADRLLTRALAGHAH